jgi:hypothetical protein
LGLAAKSSLQSAFRVFLQVSRRFGAFLSPETPTRRRLSAAKKAWLNAYGMSMRRKREIIGKLAESICGVFSAVYGKNPEVCTLRKD